LSVGMALPVGVLLLQARGLSLATIGMLFALYTGAVALLELPTGSLADSWGRRPVLASAAALAIGGNLTLGLGGGLVAVTAAMLVLATSRALASGTLEAWYVDTVRLDPNVDLTTGLSRGTTAEGLAMACGAVIGGVLPALVGGLPSEGDATVLTFSVPLLVAAGVAVVELVSMLVFVRRAPVQGPRRSSPLAALGDGIELAVENPTVRRILLRFAIIGFGIAGLELVIPSRLASLTGDPETGSQIYAVLVTVAFAITALGAATAPAVCKRLGTPGRAAMLATLLGGTAAMFTGTPVLAVLIGAFVASRLLGGPARPLLADLLHGQVDSEHRATVLSAQSVATMTGALVGTLTLPAFADHVGQSWALAAAGAAIAASALPLVRLRALPALQPAAN
jgi:MFS family permease